MRYLRMIRGTDSTKHQDENWGEYELIYETKDHHGGPESSTKENLE